MSALKRFRDASARSSRPSRCRSSPPPVDIKLATLVPANTRRGTRRCSTWATPWNKDTAGRVTLTVYPGSTDSATRRHHHADAPGLRNATRPRISRTVGPDRGRRGVQRLQHAVLLRARTRKCARSRRSSRRSLEQRLEAKGFHLLAGAPADGSSSSRRKPLRTLDQTSSRRSCSRARGPSKWSSWYVGNGFHPVALLPADIPRSSSSRPASSTRRRTCRTWRSNFQIFRDAKYMLDLRIAPLSGALVISNAAWNKISAEDEREGDGRRAGARGEGLHRRAEAGRRLDQGDADPRAARSSRSTRRPRPISAPTPTR